MSSLVDWQIRHWAEHQGLIPYRPDLVNPASVNVRIGSTIKVESPNGTLYDVDISSNNAGNPFMVEPGEWILAATEEIVTLPNCYEAEVCLRSSAARAGWQHALAGYVDPSWQGVITLELKNIRRYKSLPIYPGLELCQLRVKELSRVPKVNYEMTGRYYGDMGVQENKDVTVGL